MSGGSPFGDYARSLHALWPVDAAAAAMIAASCGLETIGSPASDVDIATEFDELAELTAPEAPDLSAAAATLEEEGKRRVEAAAKRRPSLRPGRRGARPVESELIPIGRVASEPPRWFLEATPLEARRTAPAPELPPEPLFVARWTAGILGAALATTAPDGPLDVERLVELMSRREPLRDLPRHEQPTVRAGAQVLVDLGQSMAPYLADEQWLLHAIQRVVGEESTTVLRFAGCPTRGAGLRGRRTWRPYAPPGSPQPVVVISDLGLGGPPGSRDRSTVREWRAFAEPVARAGCPLIAITPYRPEQVPRLVRQIFGLIVWDRETTATSASRTSRRARQR